MMLYVSNCLISLDGNLHQFMFDKFWQHISRKTSVNVDVRLFEWMGYDSVRKYDNKAIFIKLLKSNDIQYREIKHTDPEFVEEANYATTWSRNNLNKKR